MGLIIKPIAVGSLVSTQVEGISILEGQDVVDSRLIAEKLGVQHKSFIRLIGNNLEKIEEKFQRVRFEITPFKTKGGMQNIKIALLTENQCLYCSTLVRNNEKSMDVKAWIVKSFIALREARKPKPMTDDEIMQRGYIIAVRRNNELKAENKKLKADNTVMKPKAEYYDEVLTVERSYSTKEVAAKYNTSDVVLYRFLKEKKIVYKQNGTYHLYAKYKKEKLANHVNKIVNNGNGKINYLQLVWTEKGREFINSLMKRHNELIGTEVKLF